MKRRILLIAALFICTLWLPSPVPAASTARAMKEGIRAYDAGEYDEALSRFEAAEVEAPDNPKVRYNAASTRYKTGDYESAAKEFGQVLSNTKDPELQAKAYYNLGNTAFRKNDLKASSEYYRKALSIAPEDRQAKENLEFVLKALEEQKQQEQQQQQQGGEQQQQDQDSDKKDQQSSQSQEGEPQEQPEKGPQPKQDGQNQQEQAKEAPKPSQEKAEQPSPQEGEEKEQAGATSGEEEEKQLPEGEIREAGGAEKEKGNEPKADARQGAPLQGKALSKDEAERLLNSLSDDQRAYFREQAARKAPKNRRITEDW